MLINPSIELSLSANLSALRTGIFNSKGLCEGCIFTVDFSWYSTSGLTGVLTGELTGELTGVLTGELTGELTEVEPLAIIGVECASLSR